MIRLCRILPFLLACYFFLTSCEDDVINIVRDLESMSEKDEKVEIINYHFSNNCKELLVNISQKADLSSFVLNDSAHVKVGVSFARRTLIGEFTERHPQLVEFKEVGREAVDSLKLMMLVLVDLTLPQQRIDDEYYTVREICNLYSDKNLYVSFMTPHGVSRPQPATAYVMDHAFTQYNGDKYLYRSISGAISEMTDSTSVFAGSEFKTLLVLSDTKVYQDDSPIDPENFEMQERLVEQVRQLADYHHISIFYANFSNPDNASDQTAVNMMKLLCKLSDGIYTDGFDWPSMKHEILGRYDLDIPDYRLKLLIPDGAVFKGSDNQLQLEFRNARTDSLLVKTKKVIRAGNVFNPIIVNGLPTHSIILQGFVTVLVLILVIYAIFQFIIPYIRYRLFLSKYVTQYTGNQMIFNDHPVEQQCYYCKGTFEPGDEIVVKCQHVMHKDCWDENGQHCPEYGRHCKHGSHYYNHDNLTDQKNASFYMRWIILSLIAGLVAWIIFTAQGRSVAAYILELFFQFMYDISPADPTYQEKLTDFGSNFYQLPSFGLFISFTTTFFFSLLAVFRKKLNHLLLECLLRGVVAGLGGWLSFFLVDALSIALNLADHSFLLQWLPWPLTGCFIALCVTWRTRIRFRRYWIWVSLLLGLVSMGLWSIFYIDSLIDFRGAVLVSHIVFALGMGLCIAKEAPRSERYFLHVDGAIKPMDIALYKWLTNNECGLVTIGKSVDCELQMSWDINSTIAPRQAEIRFHKGRLCLFPIEDGVYADEGPLLAGARLPLYHGTTFTIGQTTFTYLEKDI